MVSEASWRIEELTWHRDLVSHVGWNSLLLRISESDKQVYFTISQSKRECKIVSVSVSIIRLCFYCKYNEFCLYWQAKQKGAHLLTQDGSHCDGENPCVLTAVFCFKNTVKYCTEHGTIYFAVTHYLNIVWLTCVSCCPDEPSVLPVKQIYFC